MILTRAIIQFWLNLDGENGFLCRVVAGGRFSHDFQAQPGAGLQRDTHEHFAGVGAVALGARRGQLRGVQFRPPGAVFGRLDGKRHRLAGGQRGERFMRQGNDGTVNAALLADVNRVRRDRLPGSRHVQADGERFIIAVHVFHHVVCFSFLWVRVSS